MVELLLALGAIFLLLFIHPFVVYPLSLLAIRPRCRIPLIGDQATDRGESLALCFCACNAEWVIEEKIRNLLGLRRAMPNLEILAYVDGATDRTAELLGRHAGDIKLHVSPKRRGKTYGMNFLVETTEASIVIFTDANVMLDPAALANPPRYFADPRVGCVCGHLIYGNPGDSATAATAALYWRLEEQIKRLETDTGSAMGAGGSIFAIRRRLHRRVPDDIVDDMYVSLSILCDGYRVVRAPDVRAYENALTEPSVEVRRKMRIACQAFNAHRLLWPRIRRLDALSVYKYLSHKFLRWLTVYNLALAAACLESALIVGGRAPAALCLGGLVALIVVVGRRRRRGHASQAWSILSALAATGIACGSRCEERSSRPGRQPPRFAVEVPRHQACHGMSTTYGQGRPQPRSANTSRDHTPAE